MPWKLIFFILVLILVTLFIGFNLENACNISFGVYTLENVPVFMSILLSFALGILVMIPFLLFRPRNKKQKKETVNTKPPVTSSLNSGHVITPQSHSPEPLYSDPKKK